ncbi:MAG: hypothetical protein LKF06_06200 [Prevotella sp.]|jgi:type I restriction enzyme S subunit|nr:hypothetical protein [Prevotella sp.]
MNMKNIPEIRLKGFEGEWKVTSLESVSKDCSYGVGAEAISFDGQNKYIRITDINDETREYCPKPFVSPSFFNSNYQVKENDSSFGSKNYQQPAILRFFRRSLQTGSSYQPCR